MSASSKRFPGADALADNEDEPYSPGSSIDKTYEPSSSSSSSSEGSLSEMRISSVSSAGGRSVNAEVNAVKRKLFKDLDPDIGEPKKKKEKELLGAPSTSIPQNPVLSSSTVVASSDKKSSNYHQRKVSAVIKRTATERSFMMDVTLRAEMAMQGVSPDDSLYKKIANFSSLHHTEYATRVTKSAITSTVKNRIARPLQLPTTQNVGNFTKFLEKMAKQSHKDLARKFTKSAWNILNASVMLLLLIFNRRRPGEVSRILLTDYQKKQEIDKADYKYMTRLDILLAQTYVRMQVLGKRERILPVLIKKSYLPYLDNIVANRNLAAVSQDNQLLFATSTQNGQYELSALMKKYVTMCTEPLQHPDRIRCTLLRKHVATQAQYLNLSPAELRMVADGMGHDLSVHLQVYRKPQLNNDVLHLAKYLECVGDEDLGRHRGKTLEELKEITDREQQQRRNYSSDSDEDEINATECNGRSQPTEPIRLLPVDMSRFDETEVSPGEVTRDTAEQVSHEEVQLHQDCDKTSSTITPSITALFESPKGKGRRPVVNYSRQERNMMLTTFGRVLEKGRLPTLVSCRQLIEDNINLFRKHQDPMHLYSYLQFRRNKIRSFSKSRD